MKVIGTGNTYEVFDNTLQVYDQLPPQTYIVRFSKTRGFYMEKYVDIEANEEKVYGIHNAKADKVLRSFGAFNRSLGVILSGDKGIGKSLFARMLSERAIQNGFPVIVVNEYINGISSYLESIEQEVVVLFDEFDKTFGSVKAGDGDADPQATMLTLFDGLSGGKKLFVITCNNIHTLSEYLVNRPGRFHYHFRFDYPTPDEIREYLLDKLPEEHHGEIDAVVEFSGKVNLNYDCLRAIAFEIRNGEPFESAIRDLNIVRINDYGTRYTLRLRWKNGLSASSRHVCMDMFDMESEESEWLRSQKGLDFVLVTFNVSDAEFDPSRLHYVVDPGNLRLEYDETDEACKELAAAAKASELEFLEIIREENRQLHYAV